MQCPKCQKNMNQKKLQEVTIDECVQCKGIWFDSGEFREAKDQSEPDANWLDFDIWRHEDQFEFNAAALQCSKCTQKMASVKYGSSPIEIDCCPNCHSVWLDQGEFKKIINHLNDEINKKSVSDYIKTSIQEGIEIFTGPEGMVSEWKDFITVMRMMQYRIFAASPSILSAITNAPKVNPLP